MLLLDTVVTSSGVDPFTGESYPDIEPVKRTPRRVHSLLNAGLEVEQLIDGMRIQLDRYTFYDAYTESIDEGSSHVADLVKAEEAKNIEVKEEEPTPIEIFKEKPNKKK